MTFLNKEGESRKITESDLLKLLQKVDVNSDGEIDFFEFIALIAE